MTVVLVRYSTFDSTVLLKGEAYEVALLLREAQVKSVSVSGTNNNFDYPYGMSFTSDGDSYQAYVFKSATTRPYYDPCGGGEVTNCAETLLTSQMERSMIIGEVCYVITGTVCVKVDRVDISFKRPEFDGIFYISPLPVGVDVDDVVQVRIVLASARPDAGTGRFVVEVSKLGQISVYKE